MFPSTLPHSIAWRRNAVKGLTFDFPAPTFPPHRLTVARNISDGFRYDADALARAATAPAGLVGR